jgi:hexosaminidase
VYGIGTVPPERIGGCQTRLVTATTGRRRLIRTAAGLVLAAFALSGCTFASGGSRTAEPDPTVVPLPVSLSASGSPGFELAEGAVVASDPALASAAERLVAELSADTGLDLQTAAADGPGEVTLSEDASITAAEGYRLDVDAAGIRIAASTPAGAYAALQTLRQLVPLGDPGAERTVPAVTIRDEPRFAYRSAMLDVARHFFPVDDVKRYIDQLALLKFNHLHLHLTDDQGWRIAIDAWPELTEIGGRYAVGTAEGGFYTKDDYRELVDYAAERFITIVPEVDLPGHTNAALASVAALNPDGVIAKPYTGIDVGFSTLDVDSEFTYEFLGDVLGELAAMTPGPYLHIGGDESSATSDTDYLAFAARVSHIAADTGKTVIGWHELGRSPELPAGTIGQYWDFAEPRTPEAVAESLSFVAQGGRLIMSPADVTYLDMKYDMMTPLGLTWAGGFTSIDDTYGWDPAAVIDGVGDAQILGVEAPLWAETLVTLDDIESMAFPRIAAVAELSWSRQADRDFADFAKRMPALGDRWTSAGVDFTHVREIDWH